LISHYSASSCRLCVAAKQAVAAMKETPQLLPPDSRFVHGPIPAKIRFGGQQHFARNINQIGSTEKMID